MEVAEAEKQSKLLSFAEIKALQAQVNPHFLFNSLNTVIALIRTNPDLASDLLLQLASFFRQNLNSSQNELITLQQEIERTKAYLNIEQIRFYDRLKIHYDIDQGLENILIPPLTLQPLVENALKHGLKNQTNDGLISIRIKRINDKAKIEIEDNGVGIPLYKINRLINPKNNIINEGLGLNNVNQRLIGLFGLSAGLVINNSIKGGAIVSFEIPLERGCDHEYKGSHSR
jgi:two-component system sensor histidine kinase LytS